MGIWKAKLNHTHLYAGTIFFFTSMWGVEKFKKTQIYGYL